jgi:DNA-binding MarR family transcriptional regulator
LTGQLLSREGSRAKRASFTDRLTAFPDQVTAVSRSPRRRQQPDDTKWLDAEQQWAWRQVISLVTMLPAALESDLQHTAGLTMFEYLVLANLSEADQATLRMSDLAYRANSSLSRLSHVVSRLTRRGLVTKRACPTDGRVSEVVLTKAGSAKVVDAAPQHVARVRDLVIHSLTPRQLTSLGHAAAAISDRIAEVTASTGPAHSSSTAV